VETLVHVEMLVVNNVNKQLMKLIFVIKILEVFLKSRNSELSDRKSEISDRKSEISDRKSEISDKKSEISDRKSEISDRKSEIIDNKYCTAKLEMVLCKDLNINNISIGPASYTTCRTKECHKDMIERVSLDTR